MSFMSETSLGPLIMMATTPVAAIYMYIINDQYHGSTGALLEDVSRSGISSFFKLWPLPSWRALSLFLVFGCVQAAFQSFLPGKAIYGPLTPSGLRPKYKANGVLSYLLTIGGLAALWWTNVWDVAAVYDIFGELLSTLNLISLVMCYFLYLKGKYAPSGTDNGSSGKFLVDYYWGMELHPRLFGQTFDIKQWTNCRMGMMGWPAIILCFAAKQYQLHGELSNAMIVTVALMQIYICKFFIWESGYLASMDIAHDRAGYYICWGCLVFVPSVYTSPAMYLVNHNHELPSWVAAALMVAGIVAIFVNWDVDRQKQALRQGSTQIWGSPAKVIHAQYRTTKGEEHRTVLLASGWWGMARHIHYVAEVAAALCWTLPVGFQDAVPYLYVTFLTCLLLHRVFRDEVRCSNKYGKYWDEYCRLVPYRLIPGIF